MVASVVGQQATLLMARSSRLICPSLALAVSPSPLQQQLRSSSAAARVYEPDLPSPPRASPAASVRSVLGPKSRPRRHHLQQQQKPRPRLVIFDKDGTLICFHSLWVPWVRSFAAKVEEAARLNIASKVYTALGFCPVMKKVKRGLLAEGTLSQIRERVIQLLVQHGLDSGAALAAVETAIRGTAALPHTERTVRQLHDLRELFAGLRARGIKVAICTADSRAPTMRTLSTLGVDGLVDLVVCGDDQGSMPKPRPENALFICRQLGVDPKDAMVIGDTPADLGMGRSAKLGSIVGVLSGIGDQHELASEADHLVEDVGELIPLLGC